jgi:cell division septal protein FtsQ
VYTNKKIYSVSPGREKEPIQVSSRAIWILLILIVILGLVYFFLFSPYFKIQNVYINGAGDYQNNVNDIINNYLVKKSNIFLFPNDMATSDISSQYPIFSSVKIYKGFPNALKIELIARQPVLICNSQGNEFLIDKDGIAFNAQKIPTDLPIIQRDKEVKSGDDVFTSQFVEFIKNVSDNFNTKSNAKITKIVIPDSDFIANIYSDKVWYAIFDTTKSAEKQLDNLALVLPQISGQPIQYIDLRVDDKVYYK